MNSNTLFASAAFSKGKGHQKQSDIPNKEIKRMLETHFMWHYFHASECGSEFISWTSSLLWALQFAVRKTVNLVASGESPVKLCILDTSTLDANAFLPAPGLIAKYDMLAQEKGRRSYHDDEYLIHGKLNVNGIASTVSLATLRAEGLFELVPELDEEEYKPKLRSRVIHLRTSLFALPKPISPKNGGLALWIASLFGTGLTMPMFVALLSLRGRHLVNESFLRIIRIFSGKSIGSTDAKAPW